MRHGIVDSRPFLTGLLVTLIAIVMVACGPAENGDEVTDEPENDELTDWQMEHGLGPITDPVDIAEQIDQDLAERGERVFQIRCESCHRMERRLVGPAMLPVLEGRSPEWFMNFTLAPGQNIREHPVGQSLLREYMVEMPFQNVTEEDARAIVEYLRAEREERFRE